jgi:hypothetical protein
LGKIFVDRADLRIDVVSDGKIYVLNKHDGVIRLLVPGGG